MFLYSRWRALDLPTRIRLASDLGIKKVGPTHVRDNIVESDGYLIEDVEKALAPESLHKYLGITEVSIDPGNLWELLLDKVLDRKKIIEVDKSLNTFKDKRKNARKKK